MIRKAASTASAGIASTTGTCRRRASRSAAVSGPSVARTRSRSASSCADSSSERTTSTLSPRAITSSSAVRTVKAGKAPTARPSASSVAAGSGSAGRSGLRGTWQSMVGTPERGHQARTLRRSSTIDSGAKATRAKRPDGACAPGVLVRAPAARVDKGSGRGVANLVVLDDAVDAVEQQRRLAVLDDVGVDDDLLDVAARRYVEHHVEQDVLDHGPQAA